MTVIISDANGFSGCQVLTLWLDDRSELTAQGVRVYWAAHLPQAWNNLRAQRGLYVTGICEKNGEDQHGNKWRGVVIKQTCQQKQQHEHCPQTHVAELASHCCHRGKLVTNSSLQKWRNLLDAKYAEHENKSICLNIICWRYFHTVSWSPGKDTMTHNYLPATPPPKKKENMEEMQYVRRVTLRFVRHRALFYTYLVDFVGFGEGLTDVQVCVPERVVDVTWHWFGPYQTSYYRAQRNNEATWETEIRQ